MTEEGLIKRTISEYLEIQRAQGKLWWTRLNAGSVLVNAGEKRYRLQLCPEGTPDLLVIKEGHPIFFEIKTPKKKQTALQLEMQAELEYHGASVYVVSTLEQVIEVLG